ncbi:MAG: redoxin domain-containing protein [Microcella sp.]|uniref:redoxin domain-containing protein n=1 Tax=Microcella sp. TaxID=1913979 RepID=UPI00271EFB4D|nr:redoxin domain-containing protein [Microcella sp.]MDO8337056.1 redoxin domain-containing protein [Microcella sp.]
MPLAVDSPAPSFALRDQFGRTIAVPDARLGRAVLLVFFPQAFTPTCTDELRSLAAERAALEASDVAVLAVSVDSMATLRAFDDAEELGLALLSDFWPHGAVADSYGAFLPDRGWADRVSVLADGNGIVRAVAVGSEDEPRTAETHRAMLAAFDAPADERAARG